MSATSPRIAFRADASLAIGTGHVARCLTLADRLREDGAQCLFVCRGHPGHAGARIEARGHRVEWLPHAATQSMPGGDLPAHAAWLGAGWEEDAAQTRAVLAGFEPDWLVVDHYALDARWEAAANVGAARVLAIDDLADRAHRCDLLLDQNLGRDAGDYARLVPAGCVVLAGPRHALLRPDFAAARAASLARRETPALRRVLVSLGGIDRFDATGGLLHALRDCSLPAGLAIDVVLGAQAPWLEHVRELAAALPWPTRVLVEVDDMATLMAASDLAFGAAGATTWERCCLGLPSVVMALAANQRPTLRALHAAGACLVLPEAGSTPVAIGVEGVDVVPFPSSPAPAFDRPASAPDPRSSDTPDFSVLPELLAQVQSPGTLQRLGAAAATLVDGLGTDRVAAAMASFAPTP